MRELASRQRDDAELMRQMLYGQLVSRALCVFAQLGVPAALKAGPLAVEQIATRVRAEPAALRRLLSGLVVFGVVNQPEDGVFALTSLGETLCAETPASALPTALLLADEVGATWADLARTVRTGQPAFVEAFGANLFDYLESKPERREVFDRSQAEGLTLELDELLAFVDFSSADTVVDIGGGDGALLIKVLTANPATRGVVFDLPGTAALAAERIASVGFADRCDAVAGDFFESVPGNGDVYLLSHVLHDWNDEDCRRILRTCARSMPDGASLLVVDLLAADRTAADAGYRSAALMDLYMLSLFGSDGGRERSAGQFTALIEQAGLEVTGIDRLPSGMGVVGARRTPFGVE